MTSSSVVGSVAEHLVGQADLAVARIAGRRRRDPGTHDRAGELADRFPGQQPLVERLQLRGGCHAELVAQQAAQLVVDLERLGHVAGGGQGLHQQAMAGLAEGASATRVPGRALSGRRAPRRRGPARCGRSTRAPPARALRARGAPPGPTRPPGRAGSPAAAARAPPGPARALRPTPRSLASDGPPRSPGWRPPRRPTPGRAGQAQLRRPSSVAGARARRSRVRITRRSACGSFGAPLGQTTSISAPRSAQRSGRVSR